MCQLLGLNANTPTDLMFSFTGFAHRAIEHADGFGVSFFEGRGVRSFIDTESAMRSPVAKLLSNYPIRSKNIIAHIRKATQGHVALENTHPFQRELWGRYWVFAHNGNLVNFQPKLHASFRPVGDTDSERAFCWLLQELWKNHASVPDTVALTHTLRELSTGLARYGTFNFLLSHGEALWAHSSTQLHFVVRHHPFRAVTLQDADMTVDLSALTRPSDRVAIVTTQPLTADEPWTAIPPGSFAVFEEGHCTLVPA